VTTLEKETPVLARRTVWVLAAGAGATVAGNYYSQPLLAEMARSLDVPQGWTGYVPALTQAGFALGLLLFVPLGDVLERRRLALAMLWAGIASLLAVALAPTYAWLAAASLLLGLTTVTPQLLVPFAAHLAPPAQRGRVVGTVMGGLLVGVLLSRTFSGLVGGMLGWRAVYGLAAALLAAFAFVLRAALPTSEPASALPYRKLLASLPVLLREEPALRQSCLFGAATFGCFSVLWTTLTFRLAGPPFGHGSEVAGLFGLVGVVGVLAASLAGRLGDRLDPRRTILAGLALTLSSFWVLWALGDSLWGLTAGILLLDAGVQGTHISNQTRIYAVRPEARNRLNTAYMVSYFVGGGTGSALGAWSWSAWGWPGVCAAGGLLAVVGLTAFAATAGGNAVGADRPLPEAPRTLRGEEA
jgi:predicted MFS family arabinose efflux permease